MLERDQRLVLSILAALAVIAVAVYGLGFTTPFMNGGLSKPHKPMEKECEKCHTPWQGVLESSCHACHKKRDTSFASAHAESEDFGDEKCFTCHREHREESSSLTVVTDDHCMPCHEDFIHKKIEVEPPQEPPYEEIYFSHAEHIMFKAFGEGACGQCHGKEKDIAKTSLKLRSDDDACAECHEPHWYEGDVEAEKTCMECHTKNRPEIKAKDHTLKFSHPTHKRVECGGCHGNVTDQKKEFDAVSVSTSGCIDCHKKTGAGQDCSACHTFHESSREDDTIRTAAPK